MSNKNVGQAAMDALVGFLVDVCPPRRIIKDVTLHAQAKREFITTGRIGALSGFLHGTVAASITGTALPIGSRSAVL